jgi:KAT8 regulatory NSL complex subunit 1
LHDNLRSIFFHIRRSKRAAYKFAKDRGAVASRWCWLATQISELDYKIRQHTDLRKHIKENKGAVILEEIAGFEGQLPGSNKIKSFNINDSDLSDDGLSAARIRPLLKPSFRKRKLVQTANLHFTSKKAARPRFV